MPQFELRLTVNRCRRISELHYMIIGGLFKTEAQQFSNYYISKEINCFS